MNLTGKTIEDRFLTCPKNSGHKVQQVGVDITIQSIRKLRVGLESYVGQISTDQTTFSPHLYGDEKNNILWFSTAEGDFVVLQPGVYSLIFDQGITLDSDHHACIIHRSSLLRMGARIESAMYDCGFTTSNIGAMMFVSFPIKIEKHARLAQLIVAENYSVDSEDLYNGQYQGDKDIK